MKIVKFTREGVRLLEAAAGIYAIIEAKTGRVYVGRSYNIRRRVSEHLRKSLDTPTSKEPFLYRALHKNGGDWLVVVLELVPPEHSADRETFWICFFDSFKDTCGFNLAPPIPDAPRSQAYIEAIRARKLGVPQSEETKRKRSQALTGLVRGPQSPEHIAKLAKTRKGRKHGPKSAEARAAISAKLKGRKKSKEFCERMSAARKGVPLPKGRKSSPHTDEHKAAIAQALRDSRASETLEKKQLRVARQRATIARKKEQGDPK